jgi:molybdopterin synthase catalytic subunit
VRLFASYRERVGQAELALDLPEGATAGSLAAQMARRFPSLTRDPGKLVVAVNQEYRDHGYRLSDEDEVALIPPVSGGSFSSWGLRTAPHQSKNRRGQP